MTSEPMRASELVAILEGMIHRYGNKVIIMDADDDFYLPNPERIGIDGTGKYILISGRQTITEEE